MLAWSFQRVTCWEEQKCVDRTASLEDLAVNEFDKYFVSHLPFHSLHFYVFP